MRLISCSLTERQVRDRTKTETRRLKWLHVKPGQLLCFVDKAMGLKKGQKPKRIAIVRVTSVRREFLCKITQSAVDREGFHGLSPQGFIDMFCHHMDCPSYAMVTVIRFQYIPGGRF